MKHTYKAIWSLVLALVLSLSLFSAAAQTAQAADAGKAAEAAPEASGQTQQEEQSNFFLTLNLKYIDGTPFDVSVFDGKPIFLNIWATWCPPCLEEMPHLNELYQEYGDRINIIGLHAEGLTLSQEGEFQDNTEKNALALEIRQQKNLAYPLINPDPNLFIIMNVPDYGVQISVLPTTWFIDGNGTFRNVIEGYRDKDGWKEQIEGFLKMLEEEENAKNEG